MMALLAPCLDANLRAQVGERIWCTDASPDPGAVVYSNVARNVAKELWRDRDARGRYVRLDEPVDEILPPPLCTQRLECLEAISSDAPDAQALCDAHLRACPDYTKNTISAVASREVWFSEIVQSLPFSLALRHKFARRDHINVLEADVRLSLMKFLARSPDYHGIRLLLGQDSRVCLGGYGKGRSSARRLNHVIKKCCSVQNRF